MLNEVAALNSCLKNAVASKSQIPENIFSPCGDLSIEQSLRVYSTNQVEGKFKALQKFFPAVEKQLGEQRFRNAAISFIKHFPSESFTLSDYHPQFAGFIGANFRSEVAHILDLARLEWFWHRSFLAPYKPSDLGTDKLPQLLSSMDPAKCSFVLAPSVKIVSFQYNVNSLYRHLLTAEENARDNKDTIIKLKNFMLFWRPTKLERKRMPISLPEAQLLRAMGKHQTLIKCLPVDANATMTSAFLFKMIHAGVIIGLRHLKN